MQRPKSIFDQRNSWITVFLDSRMRKTLNMDHDQKRSLQRVHWPFWRLRAMNRFMGKEGSTRRKWQKNMFSSPYHFCLNCIYKCALVSSSKYLARFRYRSCFGCTWHPPALIYGIKLPTTSSLLIGDAELRNKWSSPTIYTAKKPAALSAENSRNSSSAFFEYKQLWIFYLPVSLSRKVSVKRIVTLY